MEIKPILKWVGGKTQIIDKILDNFPYEIENYYEPFLGGGSVLLGLLNKIKENKIKLKGNIYVYDINEPLIYMYKNIQNNYIEIYNILEILIKDYNIDIKNNIINRNPNNIDEAKQSQENYYYWIRNKYNNLNTDDKKSPLGSAMFIFLNKTCFRGLFRMGPNGFNVPFGNYKNPEIINKIHLEKFNIMIKDVIFECSDFEIILTKLKEKDFVYLDPPYVPVNSKSFVSYTDKGFNNIKNMNLFKLCNDLTKMNIKFMMSNSDVKLVRDNFNKKEYKIEDIICKRKINSKNPESKTKEIIIRNY